MNPEGAGLDREILHAIGRREVSDFDDLALRIFAHQLRYNEPYARYCAYLGVTPGAMPRSWDDIPPVPAAAYKEAALCTFDPSEAELTFETSGTTTGSGGVHYMETAALYDASLLAAFHDRFLASIQKAFHYLLLVPNPAENPRSSLGYMMKRVAETYDAEPNWYIRGDTVAVEPFVRDIRELQKSGSPVFVGATAFALVQLLDALEERANLSLELPAGSYIMETGGFKGRARTLSRPELYAKLCNAFGVPESSIVSEYGMTELSSQYYDRETLANGATMKRGPAWMRSYAAGFDGKRLPDGVVGALVHVDLANRSSCIAVQTEDLGAAYGDGLVLIGREQGAELRGCSLDAESLRV